MESIGIDVHKVNSQVCIVDESGEVIGEQRIRTDRERFAAVLGSRCDCGLRPYVRRRPEDGVLHRVLREQLETFLEEARARGGGEGVPAFVERELREFLSCGVMARGFARFRCGRLRARDPGRVLVQGEGVLSIVLRQAHGRAGSSPR
jgi:hypothetical protein